MDIDGLGDKGHFGDRGVGQVGVSLEEFDVKWVHFHL